MTQDFSLFDLESLQPASRGVSSDPGVEAVRAWFVGQKDYVNRFAQAFRKSIDEVLDGQRTGRYDLYVKEGDGRVEKTEKTYLGTKVEIVVRAEFDLGYGSPMDYMIAGQHVDAKWTMGKTWTIPKEAMGHICLVMRADDRTREFQVGLLRITEEVLNVGLNGDEKRGTSAASRAGISWIVKDGKLPANFLLNLKNESPEKIQAIFRASDEYRGSGNGGQLRVNELFRQVPGQLVDRTTVVTVATQHDSPKRVRDARKHLRPEGIVVLGHTRPAPRIAEALGLPIPERGFWVSARLAVVPEGDARPSEVINGVRYGIWRQGDAPIEAPIVSKESDE
ncbi:NaeI family type II restriction endonuclease [Streptomyces niger]|uniref:NaeI family type II restriction endonuclease n=1 Tax=Streptomyces niger TaxID=66373 RepID=UPI000699D0C2|nr:NaeI family type II restriction endonuclease [Streptomyces niger]